MENQNKYQNGKIYKITDIGYNKCYIGSTCEELSMRMARHRAHFKHFLRGDKKSHIRSFDLFNEYGIENCKIELVEYFKCDSLQELRRREGEHIKNNDCVNKYLAGRTMKEYKQDNKDIIDKYLKEYYQSNKEKIQAYCFDNKEKIQEYQKEYYEVNKEKLTDAQKKYNLQNKERIKKMRKEWYQKNKERLIEKQKEYYRRKKELV